MPYAAALDANVLHPQITVDLLLRLAERGLFRVVWSDQILDEVHDRLVRRGFDAVRIRRRIELMKAAFPEAMVEDIAPHLGSVPPEVDGDDHHVVAAALAGKADAVVTNNLPHFPADRLALIGLDVQSLDDFLLNQWTLDPETVVDALSMLVDQAELNDHGVILEYQLGNTSRRLDAMLTGHSPTSAENAVVVELKQWSDGSIGPSTADNCVELYVGKHVRRVLHPSVQVGGYQQWLLNHHSVSYETDAGVHPARDQAPRLSFRHDERMQTVDWQ